MHRLILTATLVLMTGPVWAQGTYDPAQDTRIAEARVLYLSGDYAGGLALLIPEAEAGHPRAQNILAASYQHGNGVPLDATLAQDWFQRSANQGFLPAINNLGVLFETGTEGLEPDLALARDYYRQAAAQDYGPSIGNYGKFLYEGTGGPVDREEALRQFQRGVELGDRLSIEWYGYHLQIGEGIDIDLENARHHYNIAALMGSGWAADNLGRMFENGEGGPQDLLQAFEWYKVAVEQDEPYGGIDAAWLIDGYPDLFPDQVLGAAYCAWAVANAEPQDAEEWKTACDDLFNDMSPAELQQAAKRAGGL
jgi:uncharacterized protein